VTTTAEQMRVIRSGVADLVPESDLLTKLDFGRPLRVKLGVDPGGQLGLGRLEHPCHHEIQSAPMSDIGRPDQRIAGSGRAVHTHEHSLHVGSPLHRGTRRASLDT
jgi:hypothetical protein